MAKAKTTKYRFRTKFYRYNGISAAEAKGPTLIYKGRLPSFRLPWPSDIADFYSGLGSMEV